MAYIVQRKDRFYVVAYDGLDPLTGRERRRWHPAGTREDAEQVATRLDTDRPGNARRSGAAQLGDFLTDTWLPRKRVHVRATTAYRYAWMIHNYLVPRLGDVQLCALRSDHLDDLYDHLLSSGGRKGQPLAAKTVHETHLIVRNALDLAVQRRLVDRNVALTIHSPRRRGGGSAVARVWSAQELAAFSTSPRISGSTRHSTLRPTPACAEARSPDLSGATSTSAPGDCRSRGRCKVLPAPRPSSAPRPAPAAAA
ncbi:MAG: N-terminal phage integrase SAM-like domain-containing protein [Actinomycetota bacterium]|nr:N-terminal phage integrase SAM-like domain-containing protein [Actinomycetota bacterium]